MKLSPLLVLLGTLALARANDTMIPSGTYGPTAVGKQDGEESVVRMMAESIDIHFGKGETKVHCRFTFRNLEKEGTVKLKVGFPDLIKEDSDLGSISEIKTRVDGAEVEAKKVLGWFDRRPVTPHGDLGPEPAGVEYSHMIFYITEVSFPAGQDVIVERTYTADTGNHAYGGQFFDYTTLTGAIWKGTIGQADFHVTLEDGITVDTLAFEDGKQIGVSRQQDDWCSPNRKEWTIVSPTEMKMTWKDFEPAVQKTRRGIALATWNLAALKGKKETK